MSNEILTGLTGGEYTPHFDVRIDVDRYGYGFRHLHNMICRKYGTVTRRPGTVFVAMVADLDSILPSIVAWENDGVSYESAVVTTLADTNTNNTLMPVFVYYEDEMVCYEDESVVISETAVLSSSIICNGNDVLFYENEILI